MLYRSIALAIACSLAQPAIAQKAPLERSEQTQGNLRIQFFDLTPRFLAFYEAARGVDDPDQRFALWQEHYGFAAVPPGPRGKEMARTLLDEGWPQYEANLPHIRRGAAVFGDEPMQVLSKVGQVLEADVPIDLELVAYVGAFENNAFMAGVDGRTIVNFPVEMPAERRRPTMAHEFTHAVHMKLAGLAGGWERSIASTLIQEGLAMHVAREVVPGRPVTDYTEHRPGWWAEANHHRKAILQGILPALEARDSETVFRYTIGTGPGGTEREAYAAGWWVIEHLRDSGMSLAQIARVPEDEMPELARRAIAEMLAG